MCGRYSLYDIKLMPEKLQELFGFPIDILDEFPPSYNIGPYRDVPIILSDSNNRPYMRLAHWQLVPAFAESFNSKYAMFNTRDDSFDKKPYWRKLLQHSRCIFPANNFFEWQIVGGKKIPYKFERADGKLLLIGGIYSVWKDADQREYYTASMITVDANSVVGKVHGRMPFILLDGQEKIWLDRNNTDYTSLRAIIRTYPDEMLRAVRVSTAVNAIKNDSPEIIYPVEN
jgi:putative SOS response-associated peptidase YedK